MADLHSMIPTWTASAFASYHCFRALGLTVAQAAAASTVPPEEHGNAGDVVEVLLRYANTVADIGDGKCAEIYARRAGVREAIDQESAGG